MKKALLTLFSFSILGVVGAHAQTKFGVKAGVNISDFWGKDTGDPEIRVGPVGGVSANFGFSDMISLQAEALYSRKGAQRDVDGGQIENSLHYIDVPLLARINADGPFFELGPQVGYLVGANTKGVVASANAKGTDLYTKFEIGGIAGVGYQFDSGPNIGVRYNHGFRKVLADDNAPKTRVYNAVIQVQVGYVFGN